MRFSVLISTLVVSGFLAWMLSVGHRDGGIYGEDTARMAAAHQLHVRS